MNFHCSKNYLEFIGIGVGDAMKISKRDISCFYRCINHF